MLGGAAVAGWEFGEISDDRWIVIVRPWMLGGWDNMQKSPLCLLISTHSPDLL